MNPGTTALIMMVDDTPANLSVLSDLLSDHGICLRGAPGPSSRVRRSRV